MKKNTTWKFTDESSVTIQSSISGPSEFGHSIKRSYYIDYDNLSKYNTSMEYSLLTYSLIKDTIIGPFFQSDASE